MPDDAIRAFARHVAQIRHADIPEAARRAARVFLLDTLGVGVAGSSGPWVEELIATQLATAGGEAAGVWADGTRLSVAGAALCNAYQIHNAEFDCVHEAAVVHTMTALSAVVLAYAERTRSVDGRSLADALVLGVDVACNLGVASRAPLRFFRPGTAGAFAATAGLGRLMGFDKDTLVNAFGAVHGQLCGTMQAHTEGSPLLGMQVGFNARNAVLACEMAARGLAAPQAVLEGPFGYYKLFEGEHELEGVLPTLGRRWRIEEVAHKPFPSGRATHGIIDGCLALKREHGLDPRAIASVEARVPPLVHHLVGRPVHDEMGRNYGRLCASYTAARALLRDGLSVEDFRPESLRDAETLALARRVAIDVDGNPDPNALTPVHVRVRLADGRAFEQRLDIVYGHPDRPMSRAAQLEKFRGNWSAARRPLAEGSAEAVIEAVDRLEALPDVGVIVDYLLP